LYIGEYDIVVAARIYTLVELYSVETEAPCGGFDTSHVKRVLIGKRGSMKISKLSLFVGA